MNPFWILNSNRLAHVDDKTSGKEVAYYMIMGMDLMTSRGITVECEQRCIRWGGTEIPLKARNTLSDDKILHMLYHAAIMTSI
jgi:hypothetical protein